MHFLYDKSGEFKLRGLRVKKVSSSHYDHKVIVNNTLNFIVFLQIFTISLLILEFTAFYDHNTRNTRYE